ncbi:MAG: hypothetical protein GY822_20330 [Deltaproteobacteria bacterium]|nr:hypothetical protein [Deltaproteobacteria bacterium]
MKNARLSLAVALFFGVIVGVGACSKAKPSSLKLMGQTLPFVEKEKKQTVRISIKDENGKVFLGKKPDLMVKTSDPKIMVAEGNEDTMEIVLRATGSGEVKVIATAFGVTGERSFDVVIPTTIEVKRPLPKRMRMGKKFKLDAIVKDGAGRIIKKPRLKFDMSAPCVLVDPDGTVEAAAVGKCEVVITSRNAQVRFPVDVR